MHSMNPLLFSSNNVWIKQQNLEFDVAMGMYNSPAICELACLYILNLLSDIITINVGLYRDDRLAILQNTTELDTERTQKRIVQIFKRKGCKSPLKWGFPKQISLT